MTKDLQEIETYLKGLLNDHSAVFKVTKDTPAAYEVSGTIEAMQGAKKVDGIYFSTVMPKPKDIRFYFFPLYTHREDLEALMSEEVKKCLKGKTCFHIKALSDDLKKDLKQLVHKSVKLYQKDGLLAK